MSDERQQTPSLPSLVVQIDQLMLDPDCIVNGKPSIERVAARMGWTVNELNRFIFHNQAIFQFQESIGPTLGNPLGTAHPITDVGRELTMPRIGEGGQNHAHISTNTMAAIVQASDEKLKLGLDTLELTDDEKRVAMALAKFNNEHFLDSSNMISSSVLVTNIKLSAEQRKVEDRLKAVRATLSAHEENTVARQLCLQEEHMLMGHFEQLAELQTKIQRNWMEGAAQLANMQLKLRQAQNMRNGKNGGNGKMTQRSNKPGFHATPGTETTTSDETHQAGD